MKIKEASDAEKHTLELELSALKVKNTNVIASIKAINKELGSLKVEHAERVQYLQFSLNEYKSMVSHISKNIFEVTALHESQSAKTTEQLALKKKEIARLFNEIQDLKGDYMGGDSNKNCVASKS